MWLLPDVVVLVVVMWRMVMLGMLLLLCWCHRYEYVRRDGVAFFVMCALPSSLLVMSLRLYLMLVVVYVMTGG